MESTILVGTGERAETVHCYDFAKAALLQVSEIALDLALERKSCVAGRLGTELHIAWRALGSTDTASLQKRIRKLLKDLERVCAFPKEPSSHMVIIRALVCCPDQRAGNRVRKGILGFAKSSQNVINQYFKNLDHFSQSILAEDDIKSGIERTEPQESPDDYPMHVNAVLYTILKSYSLCTCIYGYASGYARHHARLMLRKDIDKNDESVAFDVLFSASPTTCHHWQDFQLCVPLRKKAVKAVKFCNEDFRQTASSSPRQAGERMDLVKPGEFCSLVRTRPGARICCHVQDSELHRLYRGLPVMQNVDSGDSLSLREVLRIGRLSNRMKLVMAYIVARSFWQYYDSPWMDSPWTSDSVHFLCEPPPDEENHSRGALYASKPYFAVEFKELDGEFFEYCNAPGVIFPYPWLLSLCIIMLEIERGHSLPIKDKGSFVANLNERWHLVKRLTDTNRRRNDFDYPHYRTAIVRCLEKSSWEQSSDSFEKDVFVRKAAIHNTIVKPLKKLLSDLGFLEDSHDMDPVDEFDGRSQPPVIPKAPAMLETNSEADKSRIWLDKIIYINKFLLERTPRDLVRAPRVAILDTGYDGDSIFFNLPGRRRKVKWRDFIESSRVPVDVAGHGTHTTATAMKVAPFASIYVARIAKDIGSLEHASQSIADAIDWAANEAKADIISMSFGFHHNVPVIVDAIRKAIHDRHGRLIFFAVASNSGGNSREMFPARLPDVFSVRETNSLGAFSDTNPPVDPDGPVSFGTLGKGVPFAWLSSVEGEVAKSGSSVATAVAAGIAALLMTIADVGVADKNLTAIDAGRLRTNRGMYEVLKRMSQDMGNRSRYISPQGIFVEGDLKKTWATIAYACTISD
ncbi:hypothetical protein LY76DRAFT_597957 [Colletotrichum caudatum]|nr:hypothetical protein LY76DRAFT_597957 [Colletotrichum caudatum]